MSRCFLRFRLTCEWQPTWALLHLLQPPNLPNSISLPFPPKSVSVSPATFSTPLFSSFRGLGCLRRNRYETRPKSAYSLVLEFGVKLFIPPQPPLLWVPVKWSSVRGWALTQDELVLQRSGPVGSSPDLAFNLNRGEKKGSRRVLQTVQEAKKPSIVRGDFCSGRLKGFGCLQIGSSIPFVNQKYTRLWKWSPRAVTTPGIRILELEIPQESNSRPAPPIKELGPLKVHHILTFKFSTTATFCLPSSLKEVEKPLLARIGGSSWGPVVPSVPWLCPGIQSTALLLNFSSRPPPLPPAEESALPRWWEATGMWHSDPGSWVSWMDLAREPGKT